MTATTCEVQGSIPLYHPGCAAAVAAVTTPEAGGFFSAMAQLSTGGVRVLVSDIEVPQHCPT